MTEKDKSGQTAVRKANTYFFTKAAVNLLFIILGALLISYLLQSAQTEAVYRKQLENNTQALNEAALILEKNESSAEQFTEIYHQGNQEVLDDIVLLMTGGMTESLAASDASIRSEVYADIAARADADYLFVIDPTGMIVLSADPFLTGTNPAASSLLTQENINALLTPTRSADGTISPVFVKNRFGTYYFYSREYDFMGSTHMIILGTDSSAPDQQTAALSDVSAVLSRASVINDGFLFAVDPRDHLFLYYKNGDEFLSGQNALQCGLSEEALEDGYTGILSIRNTGYYCATRRISDRLVIGAASPLSRMQDNNRYAVLWTVIGFCAVMMICLGYCVIVRNDFVRHGTETDRLRIMKHKDNEIFFDRSIFRRVFPLMAAGVLVMYGITFYTQTLLEITEGIERSQVALHEVTGRYEESNENRELIQEYHAGHFTSAARIISLVIQENPQILNEESDYYHAYFDENGERVLMTDDEGNPLKSVARSALLQKLCDANSIDAIYVYDENGRVISTSTDNWPFMISRNEEDQSYAFLDVLNGRKTSYVQDLMVNDLGSESQYIGTVSDYFTRKAEDGSTEYVSRFEFERSANETGLLEDVTGEGITRHHSLIQIELSATLNDLLLESTNVESILSTSMLSGGSIVMFDATEAHTCLYSPTAASIGKTAEELGVSPKALSGADYYGFSRINGTEYFQYYRYLDGYYIATALPKQNLYTGRAPIALVTAVISFIIILLLSGTITLTSSEEENYYRTVSEEEEEDGLNAAIFSIILPSGRQSSTTRASARWNNRSIPWNERGPEQKLAVIISAVFAALMLYVLASILGFNTSFSSRSIIQYVMSGLWDRNWNVFALTACAIVIMSVIIFTRVLMIPINIISSLLGTRGETLAHLIMSILRYGGAIGALFYCLYLLGVDTASLLAGASIMSLVIGLGSQSLIQDILAGIFIVFEGEFRVGDIVTIHDFRGTVMDIGLRTTKIQAPDGNIKIFNNNSISGVLNMTKAASFASIRIDIEYGQDIDYVEAVLRRDLPALAEQNPMILDGPDYLGVAELGASGVTLMVGARCSEQNVRSVIRFLNREVLQIFYRNDINVPFDNITVSSLDMTDRKTIDDFKEEDEDK